MFLSLGYVRRLTERDVKEDEDPFRLFFWNCKNEETQPAKLLTEKPFFAICRDASM